MDTPSSPRSQGSSDSLEEPPGPNENEKIINEYKYINTIVDEKEFHLVTEQYPFVSTSYYLSLAKESPYDPIMRQLCPSIEEVREKDFALEDPLNEEGASPVPGLVHRYPDRVLMIITNVCFMNCRHCTRKRLWKGGRKPKTFEEIKRMIDYVREHREIRDVILSGGDPLTFSDEFLEAILTELKSVPHVEIIRIGTRAPVVKPSRITDGFARLLSKFRSIWLNTQFNHVREITPYSEEAVRKILYAGVPVNNQSVLLKGINDSVKDMLDLCQGLLKIGVRPYYLFHCDPVQGAIHFRTPISTGIEIISKMRGYTSGLAVPTFVVDAVGGGGKIPLGPQYMISQIGSKMILRNFKGKSLVYDNFHSEVLVS